MATARRVVLIPGQSISHLTPMMEFAAVCLRRGLAVTVAVPDPTLTSPGFRSTIGRYASRLPSLSVHSLPPPPADDHSVGAVHPFIRMQAVFRSQAPGLRDFLRSLPAVHALVADMFAAYLLDVAAEVGVPGHLFYCTGAANLTVFLELPSFCSGSGADLKDLGDAPVSFPGVPTMPASHLVDGVLDSGTDLYAAVLDVFGRMATARGILVNTFEALEGSAVAAIRDGRCLRGRAAPRVYCVGPLIAEGGEEEERHPCLPWLDAQPEGSVVYICFGSRCTASLEQIREMAKGLEMSGYRFLWVLRAPPAFAAVAGEPDATLSLLPEGFLARTAGRGLVVTASWVPQMDVLRHASTGAFMTHCGWNSTLEAAATGVPMVCWPLEAEQWMNKVYIVEEMKVGVAVRGYNKPGVLVSADNVDATVRQIMDMESEGRRAVVERAMAVKESAAAAWKEGGSSCAAFAEFVKQME
ncbi:anthocyanidin 5,3-O-glucosyltransferase-like [Triticum dicoccoides]|uniref:anthocyanidin 5,3-O-glucosyltransferase-like n=1 Tax=Triticum dicoccoides TaxID=85692 RepID=UPI001890C5FD|nr:anthocyanidin 5,3-O-glucosyltransferase-like [Triticum dicoccoides]